MNLSKKDCVDGIHKGPFDEGDCWGCSTAHVEEFGQCIGVVEGLTDYNNSNEPHDPNKVGPEYDVRWQPSNLRYGYQPEHLELVK